MQFRLTHQLLVALAAPLLLCAGTSPFPAWAQEQSGDSGPKVHVYPGAQPINVNATPDNNLPAASAPATGNQAPQKPSAPIAESDADGQNAPAAADDTDSSASEQADTVAKMDELQRKQQEQQSQDQVAAAQHYILGTHYFSKWDLDLAEVEFDESVSIFPELKIAHRDLCLVSLLKLNLPRSLAEFMMVTGITDPLAYNIKDKGDLDEKAMRMHYRKALWWGKQYNWTESITELLWAQTYSPSSAAIHHSLAFAYASSSDFQKAENEYKLFFSEQPQDASAHADFADMLMDKGQSRKAEAEMRKAVELSPNAAALHVDLGWIAESHQDYATAANEFQAAVALSPKHAGLWAHLGRLLEHQGQLTQAQDAYSKALALDNDCQEAKNSLDRLKQLKPSA